MKTETKEFLNRVRLTRDLHKKPLTLKLKERTLLYLKDLNISPTKAVTMLLESLLTDAGVDLSIPHPKETVGFDKGLDKDGNPIKIRVRHEQLVDTSEQSA